MESLPLELSEELFKLIPLKDLCNLVLVSHGVNTLTCNPMLWSHMRVNRGRIKKDGLAKLFSINRYSKIQKVDLSWLKFASTKSGICKLLGNLKAIISSSVEELDLKWVNLKQVPVEPLAQTAGHVRKIELDFTELSTQQCLAVLETCFSSFKLVDLSIEGINLFQVPAARLGEATAHLQVLNLYSSSVTADQCRAVLEACVASPTLVDLSLGDIRSLPQVDASLLAQAARDLKQLNLDNNELSTEQYVAVLETCTETSPLEVLNLGHMDLYDVHLPAQLLGEAARHLRDLDLFGSQPLLRDQIIALLEACVASSTSNVGIYENLDYLNIPADLLVSARNTGRIREN